MPFDQSYSDFNAKIFIWPKTAPLDGRREREEGMDEGEGGMIGIRRRRRRAREINRQSER